MDLAILITVATISVGFGIWFTRIQARLNGIDNNLAPLVILHKEDLIKYYLEKGIMPNPSLTPRRKYLIDSLESDTISYQESQELIKLLRDDERKAKEAGNTEALVAILGLIALVVILASLTKKG